MEIVSFAKINLYLEILGKRPDGYHELITLMCCIDLADTLRLQFDTPANRITCAHPQVPEDDSNLALKAAGHFFHATGTEGHIDISIEKNIPVGAGLGGGSSNAAAVLQALNRHHQYPLSAAALMETARKIGADVPFFIEGRPALATGIGDRLSACPRLPDLPVVLIYPGTPVSTADVYRKLNFGLTKTQKINTKSIFRHIREKNLAGLLYNDLEAAAFEINPEIAAAKSALMEKGADAALMTGSGSAVFGIFPDRKSARSACSDVKGISGQWKVLTSRLKVC